MMKYKTTRSFQDFRASPVVSDDDVIVGEIQGTARGVRYKNHRSKLNTFTFYPNAEGERRGLKQSVEGGVRKLLDNLQKGNQS